MSSIVLIIGVAAIALGLLVLIGRLFWPRRQKEIGAVNNWEQRNDLDSPSLDNFRAPQSLSDIQVGLGAQDLGGGR